MSIAGIQAAFASPIASPTQKAILVVLGHLANAEHVCAPTIAEIVEATAFSERTVQSALRDLEGAGLIKRHARTGWNGASVASAYYLVFVAEPHQPIVFLSARESRA